MLERYILLGVLGISAVLAYNVLANPPSAVTKINNRNLPGVSSGDYDQVPTNQTDRNQRARHVTSGKGYGFSRQRYF